MSGSYDNKNVVFYENGVRKELASASSIVKTTQQSVLVLGMDPMGNSVYVSQGVEYLKGEIMSIRVYNRALSQSEIQKNYKIDKIRFGI